MLVNRPAESHESNCRADGDGQTHYQAKFRLIDTVVPPAQEADDDVADFSSHRRTQYTADERAEVYQTDLEGGEVVCVSGTINGGDGFGKDDQPTYRERVDYRTPQNTGVCEEDEWPQRNVKPILVP